MRVGLVVFANKWTGAGAVAELCCRALRAAGVEAKLLFIGGRNLERRLEGRSWAKPGLVKERTPAQLRANLGTIKSLTLESDIVVCHLPHDHLLCVAASVHRQVPLVRAYRSPRHLRQDPYHAFLDRRVSGALLGHSALENDLLRSLESVPRVSIPVPTEDRFRPVDGAEWRQRFEIPQDVPIIGSVGKLARGRGFSLLLEATSRLAAPAQVVVVGHGEHRPNLEKRASALGLDGRIHWTGYQERALPELYSVMDVVLFIRPGSDWGHRAISEAQGCGRPVIAAALPGVGDLIEDGVTGRIVSARTTDLANAMEVMLRYPEAAHRLADAAAKAVETRRMAPVGHHLAGFLREVLARTG